MAINLTSKLDYKILDVNERIKLVDKIINDNKKYIDDHMDNYFNGSPKSGKHGDALSDSDEICSQLETLTNYISSCPKTEEEKRKENEKEEKYNFYTDKKLVRKMNKELHYDGVIENMYVDSKNKENIIDFLIVKGSNFKKEIKQEIFKKDLQDPDLIPIQEYQKFINLSKQKLDKLRKENKNKTLQYQLIKHMNYCKVDQIYCKDALKGTIYFKNPLPNSTEIDYDQFDFFNKEHIKELLKIGSKNMMTDLGVLTYDLEQLIKKIKLSKQDKIILEYWRNENFTQKEISDALNVSPSYISSTLNKIAERIIGAFEVQFEDYYYLNLVKGHYKKCSLCGEIKLANERYFRKHPNTNDGFQSQCLKCEQNG